MFLKNKNAGRKFRMTAKVLFNGYGREYMQRKVDTKKLYPQLLSMTYLVG
jgi:hypothetical protein